MSNTPNGGDRPVLAMDKQKTPKHYNRFPLSYKFANTEKFGEITPFFRYFGTEGDKNVLLHSRSSVDSMSLHAPILQSIRKNKDFYIVDRHAILPRTWDFIKTLPERGDDIVASDANSLLVFRDSDDSGISEGLNVLSSIVDFYKADGSFNSSITFDNFKSFCHFLAIWDCLFSHSSLFAQFRMPLADFLDRNGGVRYTDFLDSLWALYHAIVLGYGNVVTDPNVLIEFQDSNNQMIYRKLYNTRSVSDRVQLIYDIIENPNFANMTAPAVGFDWSDLIGEIQTYTQSALFKPIFKNVFTSDSSANTFKDTYFPVSSLLIPNNVGVSFNIDVIICYQLCCAEYFTNDHVDYIFDAEHYRQLFEAFAIDYGIVNFNYNGLSLPFDGFSAKTLLLLSNIFASDIFALSLFLSLISRKRSLRYRDYFTGSRTTPLAIGDNDIHVNNNVASIIDITQKIQTVRLRMAVHRVGRKAKKYIKNILGGDYRTRNDVPVKIGHIDESLYTEETQNTASDQLTLDNSRSAVLKGHNNRFAFETDIDEDSIVLGLSSYDVVRFYDRGFDPFALKVDRFDMFIPELQYIGDQQISRCEINAGVPVDLPFSYTTRNMEYKTAVDYCAGDFRDSLSSWIFTQPTSGLFGGVDIFLNPDFIRSSQRELDKYYIALTGTTPSTRYHFICKYNNECSASRNMVVDPQILR